MYNIFFIFNYFIYIYIYMSSLDISWSQIGLDIDGEADYDLSGYSVSLSSNGNIVAIGARYNNINGDVRVYELVGSSWSQKGQDINGQAAYDESGFSVSLSSNGNIVAIGARYNNVSGNDSGHVRVYEFVGGSWLQKGQDIGGEASSDESGYSVSLSSNGNILAIGARYNDGSGNNSGHVRIYEFVGGSWSQKGQDINGEAFDDNSGYSVSLSSNGNIVAIGAPYNDGNDSGHVRVYNFVGSSWSQMGQDIDGQDAGDRLGYSVSLSSDGTTVAIGAPYNDGSGNNSGHVRVYEFVGNSWSQKGQDINGEASGDNSGFSVSLSSDGTIVAIGAPYNDGNESGHVRVYEFAGGSWSQLGQDIDGEADYDYSGLSVSLSSDGTRVAIGAPYNNNKGHVRVYTLSGREPISNICFPAGTPINTDQGIICIEKINSNSCTIRGNKIETITKTITQDKYLVCIEKDALAKNIPSQKTLISKNHGLLYNGKMIRAAELLKLNNEGIYKVKYNGETLYNVLLKDKHDKMIVNNLICETLDPENGIARMYLDLKKCNYSDKEKEQFIKEYNNYVKEKKTFVTK
jgi:hypothetical protein